MGYTPRQPDEKYKKGVAKNEHQSSFGYIRRQKWTNPLAKSATAIKSALTLTAGAQAGVTAGITQPDFPRILTIKGTKAGANLTGNVVIYGTDIRGNAITDTIALNDDTEVAGLKAFKTITKIDFPARVTAGDTVSIGRADALGLDRIMSGNEVFGYTVDGVKETTLPTVTFNSSDISKNTVLFNTALANTKVYVVDYVATEITADKNTTA
jgi:hypothetical protein